MTSAKSPVPRLAIGLLGLVTVVAYGACYYAYGVLIQPIHADTRWSLASLGAVFSAVLALNGVVGVVGGRLSDRVGTRLPFLAAGTLGAGAMMASSYQTSFAGFAVCYAFGCGIVGAMGFYHITQPAAARVHPEDPSRAIVWLTILGVFASPIYLPLTAKLIQWTGWHTTIRIEAATVAVALLLAARVVNARAAHQPVQKLERARDAMAAAWKRRAFRAWVAATLLGGAAADVMLVYQVPAMIAGGLPITTAATIAGARGLAQLAGRVPLSPTLRRLGARRTLVAANLAAGVAAALLLESGNLVVALTYTVLAGASLGAISTLQGIYTHELIEPRHLGMLMGAQQAIFGVGGAVGPVLAGALIDSTGTYTATLAATTAVFAASATILLISRG